MGTDAFDDFVGPRTMLYFTILLCNLVLIHVLGVILDQLYDFSWLAQLTGYFIYRPGSVLVIAGLAAMVALGVSVVQTIGQRV